jgi:hydrogenase maturation factor
VVLEPADPLGQALVRTANGEEWVDVTVVGDVAPNDLVLVHAGTAIARLDHPTEEVNR